MAALRLESLTEQTASSEPLTLLESPRDLAVSQTLGLLSLGGGLYRAAYPGYQSNFSRDSLVAGHLRGDETAIRAQIAYSAYRQAHTADPITGAEPGKIHHEDPPVIINGASSAYNACDTTAAFLSSIASLAERGDRQILNTYHKNIKRATGYILNHVENDIFYEDSKHSGADKFALKVTYWKDSELNNEHRKIPVEPVVYSLAHFQTTNALGRIASLSGDKKLGAKAQNMMETGLEKLWRDDHFVTAIDAAGEIDSPSSDSLHALLHIPETAVPAGYAARIEKYMEALETPMGYRTGLPVSTDMDPYHTAYVWPHEQANMHIAAKRHSLLKAQSITERVKEYIPTAEGFLPELLDAETGEPAGNKWQLWTAAAVEYFENPDNAFV